MESQWSPLATPFKFVDAGADDANTDDACTGAGPPALPTTPAVTARAVISRRVPSGDAMYCDEK
jgi:hypothetical protein